MDQRKSGKWVFKDKTFDFQPFYIGKGCRDRETAHLFTSSLKGKSLKNNKIKSILRHTQEEPIHYRVYENLSEEEALSLEIEMIKYFGRVDLGTGILTNMTDGGDTSNLSKGTRRIIAKKNHMRLDKNTIHGLRIHNGNFYSKVVINTKNVHRAFKTKGEALEAYDKVILYLYEDGAVLNYPENKDKYLQEDLELYYKNYINNTLSNKGSVTKKFGLRFNPKLNKWEVPFPVMGKKIYLGIYETEQLAAEISDIFILYFDLDCALNYPEKLDYYKSLNLREILSLKIGKKSKKTLDDVEKIIYTLKVENKITYRNKRQINTKI